MTTTPKSVITAVVVILGLIALAVVGGEIVLRLLDKPLLPNDIVVIGAAAAGAIGGVLASTRTTPELPSGSTLTGGAVTLTTPTMAQDAGETASGSPVPAYATQPIVAADHPTNAR